MLRGLPLAARALACVGLVALARGTAPPQSALPYASETRLEERPGVHLVLREGMLRRVDSGGERALDCTDPRGPGAVRGIARDPGGVVFVAAENGLYLLSPDVVALDPVRLADGAPLGAPTSVVVDARRRVWLATEQAFGVVDPCFFWGRTFGAEDGLPVPGPYRVEEGAGGALVVTTPVARWEYRPDLGPVPPTPTVTIDGVPADHARAARDRDAPIALAAGVEGETLGGASFRQRIDRHHIWRTLDAARDAGPLDPGRHELEVITLDRDLNRSPPSRIPIEISYPEKLRPIVLVPLVAIAAAIVLALAVWRTLSRGGTLVRGVVSGLILVVIAGQLLAGIFPHAKGWPFVGFDMYAKSTRPGAITYAEGLVGIEADGTRRRMEDISLGVVADSRWHVLTPILERGEPVAREWIARHNRIFPERPLAGLAVCVDRRRLCPEGPVPIAPLVLAVFPPTPAPPGGTDGL